MTDAASPLAMPGVAPPPDAWDVQTDVLVIGAGAAGLVAGLRALFHANACRRVPFSTA